MDHLALEAPSTRLSGVLVCVALLAASSVLSAPASETPRPALLLLGESDRLAGVLPFRSDMLGRWCWSGAWLYPVGDPHSLTGQPETRYVVSRGIELRPDGSVAHQGVDLSNRRAGGLVRAAATGIVVSAEEDTASRYGVHVVLAHRLEDGAIAYSVYAHLVPGSLHAHRGEMVAAGWTLGSVGRSGNASSAHLHFEVRVAGDPRDRWEKARVVDPLRFVRARLPAPRPPEKAALLEWAECAALIDSAARGDEVLERGAWWRMVARAARHDLAELPSGDEELCRALAARRLLAREPQESDAPVTVRELERDLRKIKRAGLRVPAYPAAAALAPVPSRAPRSRRTSMAAATNPFPEAVTEGDAESRKQPITVAEACLALAGLAAGHRSPSSTPR